MKRFFSTFITLICICVANPSFCQKQGQELLDSLLNELPKQKDDTNKVNVLFALSYNIFYINHADGLKYGDSALSLAKKLNWEKGIGNALIAKGMNQRADADYPAALKNYFTALQIFDAEDNKERVAVVLGRIGFTYFCQSNFSKAFEYQIKALALNEKYGSGENIERDLENIGEIYCAQSDHRKALEYLLRALKIAKDLNLKRRLGVNLAQIGDIYALQNKYDSALDFYRKAIEVNKEVGDLVDHAMAIDHIGNVYLKKGNSDTALSYFIKALGLLEKVGNKSSIVSCYREIGQSYLDKCIKAQAGNKKVQYADLQQALHYTENAINTGKEVSALQELQLAFKNLSSIQELSGDYPASLESHKKYIAYRDSVFSQEKTKEITGRELEYIYNRQSDSLRFQRVLAENKLSTETKLRNREQAYFTVGIIVLLLFSAFVYKNLRTQKKLNNTITELVTQQEKTIEQRTADLYLSNQKLRDLIAFNAHQIREPLTRITGTFLVRDSVTEAEFNREYLPELERAANDLDKAIKDVISRTQDET